MISLYKENEEKYENILQYIRKNNEMTKELKQEIIKVAERYRICIYAMEEQQVIEEIGKCQEEKNVLPLKKHLHEVIFGNSKNTETYESEKEYEYESIY